MKKGGAFKWVVVLILGGLIIAKNTGNDDYYYYDTYEDNYYYEDTYYADSYNYSANDVVGIWVNDDGTIAIYDTGYAEVSAPGQSADFSWSASDTMITLVPYDSFQYEPVTMSYEIYGNTGYFTIDGCTEEFYRY